jgi:hypothetical protein
VFPPCRRHEERPLSVHLDLELDREPVCGCIRSERGRKERFVGWLGFLEALAKLRNERGAEKR